MRENPLFATISEVVMRYVQVVVNCAGESIVVAGCDVERVLTEAATIAAHIAMHRQYAEAQIRVMHQREIIPLR